MDRRESKRMSMREKDRAVAVMRVFSGIEKPGFQALGPSATVKTG